MAVNYSTDFEGVSDGSLPSGLTAFNGTGLTVGTTRPISGTKSIVGAANDQTSIITASSLSNSNSDVARIDQKIKIDFSGSRLAAVGIAMRVVSTSLSGAGNTGFAIFALYGVNYNSGAGTCDLQVAAGWTSDAFSWYPLGSPGTYSSTLFTGIQNDDVFHLKVQDKGASGWDIYLRKAGTSWPGSPSFSVTDGGYLAGGAGGTGKTGLVCYSNGTASAADNFVIATTLADADYFDGGGGSSIGAVSHYYRQF